MEKIQKISIVVPVYNESSALPIFHESLADICLQDKNNIYEIIYCDDGSSDDTPQKIKQLCDKDKTVKYIRLSRNFGKEYALTAGIELATGDAILTIDGDGQHPVGLIPEFIKKWQDGADVVVGIRNVNQEATWFKKTCSSLFYKFFNSVSSQKLTPGTTDFCLIDSTVQQEFIKLKESRRITRGLIEWLGFDRAYIYFDAKPRQFGQAQYSTKKLFYLAANGLISMSTLPLMVFGLIGIGITICSFILGMAVIIEQIVFDDPLGWDFTGTAQLSILVLFLVGIILVSQGLLALYISHIHNQTQQRPVYVIDYKKSQGFSQK